MQRLVFLFLCVLVTALARRNVPQSPPRAYLPKGYPYGWGLPHPQATEEDDKKEKEVKEVKRGKLHWNVGVTAPLPVIHVSYLYLLKSE